MGFKFRKSIKLAPGVKLNLGKKSVGVSVGGEDMPPEDLSVQPRLPTEDGSGSTGGNPKKPKKPWGLGKIALVTLGVLFIGSALISGLSSGLADTPTDTPRTTVTTPSTTNPSTTTPSKTPIKTPDTTTTTPSTSGSTGSTTAPSTPSNTKPTTPSTTTPTAPTTPSNPTPAPDPTPAPNPAPAEREIPYKENYHGHVYATTSGECYHYEADCGGKNSKEITWDTVDSRHLRPCKKCVLK